MAIYLVGDHPKEALACPNTGTWSGCRGGESLGFGGVGRRLVNALFDIAVEPVNLRDLARALGGEVSGRQVLAPGPGHSPRDRSLAVRLSRSAPDGLLVFSH